MRPRALSVVVLCVALLLQGLTIAHAHGAAHAGGPICVKAESKASDRPSARHGHDSSKKKALAHSACSTCSVFVAFGPDAPSPSSQPIAIVSQLKVSAWNFEPRINARNFSNAPPTAPPALPIL